MSVIVVERKGESVSVYVSVQCDGRNMSDTPGPTWNNLIGKNIVINSNYTNLGSEEPRQG